MPIDADAEFDALASDAWAAGRAAWPGLDLDLARFTAHLRRHLSAGGDAAIFARLAVGDLYLACACLHAVPGAASELDRVFLAHVAHFVRRVSPSPAFADDVRQLLREKLLMAPPGRPARIGDYAGVAPLLSWLRVATVRTALNLRRDSSSDDTESLEDAAMAVAGEEDAELGLIQRRYREIFREAVHEALGKLPDEQRRAMRLHLVGRLTTARIGVMFQVDQSTIVRWLASARTTVRARARERLSELLQLTPAELDSLAALLLSGLDVSLETALRTHSG
jgi:RNA polymerase sigma-70 factor (ECF subfamily)